MKFRSPPNLEGYYRLVWQLARRIPRGHVASYGQLALMLPAPQRVTPEAYLAFGPRWVGGAMAHCPENIPWHRVLNAQGRISARPGAAKQRKLLEAEGVVFARDRVDLKRYGWRGLA